MTDRRSVQKLLDDYLATLNESADRNSKLIVSVRKKIARLENEKKEVSTINIILAVTQY